MFKFMVMISNQVYVCGKLSPERMWLIQQYFAHVKVGSLKDLKKMYDLNSIQYGKKFSYNSQTMVIYLHKYTDIRKTLSYMDSYKQNNYSYVICFIDGWFKGMLNTYKVERFSDKFNAKTYITPDVLRYRNIYNFFKYMFKKNKFKIVTKNKLSDTLNQKKIKTK